MTHMHIESERAPGSGPTLAERLEPHVFGHRKLILAFFTLLTVVLGAIAVAGLRLDTNFNKQLPLDHEYIRTYLDHKAEFGGANRLLIAVVARDGNMFTPEFFEALKIATDEVFFIEGVDRSPSASLWMFLKVMMLFSSSVGKGSGYLMSCLLFGSNRYR